MKLDIFITQVLQDINLGIQNASNSTSRKYYVNNSDGKGVNFDVAVTTVNSSESETEGKAKAGIVEVLGAGVSKKIDNKTENSEISRIQFTIYVPIHTETETAVISRQMSSSSPGGVDWQ